MGNDPGNNVDPTGGIVPMSPFARFTNSIQGLVAKGAPALTTLASVSSGANSAINAGNLLTTFAKLAALTIHATSVANNVTQHNALATNVNFSSGSKASSEGARDAVVNALLLGAPTIYESISGKNVLDDYENDADRFAYVTSRTATDALIASISASISTGADAASGAAQLFAIGGAATGIGAVAGGTVAGITKVLSLYGKSVAAAASMDAVVLMAKYHMHHNDSKMYGGDPKQEYQTRMLDDQHRALHKEMTKFMKEINRRLVPGRGRKGTDIVREFTREYLLERLSEFYKSPIVQREFKEAADNFFKLHPRLK